MATESKPSSKPSRVVAVAIDNSEYAEKAFDCEYSFIYSLSIFHWKTIFFLILMQLIAVIIMHTISMWSQNDLKNKFQGLRRDIEKRKILETFFQFENETLKTVAAQYADSHVL